MLWSVYYKCYLPSVFIYTGCTLFAFNAMWEDVFP